MDIYQLKLSSSALNKQVRGVGFIKNKYKTIYEVSNCKGTVSSPPGLYILAGDFY